MQIPQADTITILNWNAQGVKSAGVDRFLYGVSRDHGDWALLTLQEYSWTRSSRPYVAHTSAGHLALAMVPQAGQRDGCIIVNHAYVKYTCGRFVTSGWPQM